MADDDLRVKIALALELIDDPASDASALFDAIAALSSSRPVTVINLTDPPTSPRCILGEVEATGADANEAAHALGTALRARLAKLASSPDPIGKVDLAAPVSEG